MAAQHIDIIILSYGKTEALRQVTKSSLNSLLASEDPTQVIFNILLIESCPDLQPYQYPQTTTLYPKSPFGYHKYLNIGIRATSNEYICLCNNDLVYHKGWASAILRAMAADPALLSVSPFDDHYHLREGFAMSGPPIEGYLDVLSGWCIFVKRSLFLKTGYLDEHFTFWYCDADYCQTLIKNRIKNILVPEARVTHLGSSSFKTLDENAQRRLTALPRYYYNYKWQHRSYLRYLLDILKFRLGLSGRG